MNAISNVGDLIVAGTTVTLTLSLGLGSYLKSNRPRPDPKEVAVKRALSLTTREERRWLREFFIHCGRGEVALWMPITEPNVISLSNSGLIDSLGGHTTVFRYGPLEYFRLNPYARKVMLGWSRARYNYGGSRLSEENQSSEFERWSEITFRVKHMPWQFDASFRNRFRSLDAMGFARNHKVSQGRPLFFESLQCMQENGDPVGMVYNEANRNGLSGVNSIRGRMPPQESSFFVWLFS